MKANILFLLFSIFFSNIFSQNVIWFENFESYSDGTQNAVKWTTSANNCDADGSPGTAGNNFWGVRTTLGNKEFCCEDIEGLTCCGNSQGASDNLWISQNINIAGFSNVSIFIQMRAEGNMECNTCGTGQDLFKAEYQINGGAWINFLNVCGLSNGQSIIDCIDVGSGTTLRIRVLLGNQADDEEYYFDNVYVYESTCSIVLPVELLYFDGFYDTKNELNELNWSTATEYNNDYFIVEHSLDGELWNYVDKVDGAGNSIEIKKYKIEHKTNNLIDYYRLIQVDFDGKTRLQKTISIKKDIETPISIEYYNMLGQKVEPKIGDGLLIVCKKYLNSKIEYSKIFY
jgi:hypothetical protein